MLEKQKPERVFYYFSELSKIPRGSGNTKAVSDYVVNWAKEKGFFVRQDNWNNVIIRKEASIGRENEPGIVIQGHLDMVTEKAPGSSHDFLKDPIELVVDGDFLKAKDTTLGADDGIAVAMAMALLEEDCEHPMLEAIFTTDEETGMDGARNIDLSDLRGSYVLNLDSEDEGVLTAGCAGGAKVTTKMEFQREICEGTKYEIFVTGLKGGHSGVEIDKERANANLVLARGLRELSKIVPFALLKIEGGHKDNVIPREGMAQIVVAATEQEVETFFHCFEEKMKEEYAGSDADISIVVKKEIKGRFSVLTQEDTDKVLFYLNHIPNGPVYWNQNIPNLVETSCNLGILYFKEDYVFAQTSVRSSVSSRKRYLIDQICDVAEMTGGQVEVSGEYPAWAYRQKSELRDSLIKLYEEMYQESMKVDVIHAGLECGYLLQKKPDLDVVSFGPQTYDIHTTEERLSISSVQKIYEFVKRFVRIHH